jgi:hypothetical protein
LVIGKGKAEYGGPEPKLATFSDQLEETELLGRGGEPGDVLEAAGERIGRGEVISTGYY